MLRTKFRNRYCFITQGYTCEITPAFAANCANLGIKGLQIADSQRVNWTSIGVVC